MTVMLVEWVFSSAFLILAVLALRAALGKRVSARLRYALWAVVLVRLLVPVQLFTSPIAGTRIFSESRVEQDIVDWPSTPAAPSAPDNVLSLGGQGGQTANFITAPQAPDPPTLPDPPEPPAAPDLTKVSAWLGWVWLAGSAAVALVLLASNLRFYGKLRRERIPLEGADCPLRVYAAVGLPSPCLFGLFRPAVYVTPEAAVDPDMLRHVLAHEYTHYRQGDHIWSLLRCGALAVHWWDPLVWLAAVLSQRDAELACDEGALKRLGDGERAGYGGTLLALVTAKPRPADLLRCATTMAGDKKSLKERIGRIAKAPKRVVWAVVAAVLVTALACACAFGQAAEPEEPSDSLDELAPIYTMNGDRNVLIEGLDGAYVEWGRGTNGGSLYLAGDVAFCCPRLAGETSEGGVMWADGPERDALTVSLNVDDERLQDGAVGGFGIHFTVDLARDVVTEREFTSLKGDKTIELTGQEMLDMARVLARLLTGAEDYYNSQDTADGPEVSPTPAQTAGQRLEADGWELRSTETVAAAPDLNRNGVPETVVVGDVCAPEDTESHAYGRGVGIIEGDELLWMGWGSNIHAGEDSFLLYDQGGEDYLMEFNIYGQMGQAHGDYRIFTLENGTETTVRENHVEFDYCTDSLASVKNNFDPEAVAAFVDEVDGLLEHCTLLVDTGDNYRGDPPEQVQVDLRWLENYAVGYSWLDGQTTLENLVRFKMAAEHPAFTRDLNGDMLAEQVYITQTDGCLRVELWDNNGNVIWSDEGYYAHAGYNTVFLCTLNDRDYLLRYHPYMGQGWCNYSYELFTLTRDGKEKVVRENSVTFDINFGLMHESFDPEAIAAFMDEINGLLSSSVQLINTDIDLLGTFQAEGRLYDSLWWLDMYGFTRDPSKTLQENLRAYRDAMEGLAARQANPYLAVIQGERSLYSPEHGAWMTLDEFCADVGPGYTVAGISDFSVLDLDGDGAQEVVLNLDGTYRQWCVVLHEQGGEVRGYALYIRWMNTYMLKEDGAFDWSSSAFENGWGKLRFTEDGYESVYTIWSTIWANGGTYYIGDQTVSQAEFDAADRRQAAVPDAVWQDFTEENVKAALLKG